MFAVIGCALGALDGFAAMLLTFIAAGLVAWPILLVQKFRKERAGKITELAMAPFMAVSTGIVLILLL